MLHCTVLLHMKRNTKDAILMKSAEVVRLLGLGDTAGFRYLKHLEANNILKPIRLPGLKTHRWRKDEVLELTKNRDEVACPEFQTNR